MLNRGVIGQIKKLKRNFDKFQSYGEIESNRRFEVYSEVIAMRKQAVSYIARVLVQKIIGSIYLVTERRI